MRTSPYAATVPACSGGRGLLVSERCGNRAELFRHPGVQAGTDVAADQATGPQRDPGRPVLGHAAVLVNRQDSSKCHHPASAVAKVELSEAGATSAGGRPPATRIGGKIDSRRCR
jgi:hypothetical protein